MELGTSIEVCLDGLSLTWYQARCRDVTKDRTGIVVCLEGDPSHDYEVDASQVRLEPDDPQEDFCPEVDSCVEVKRPPSGLYPSGWAHGIVRVARGACCYVSLTGQDRTQDMLVRKTNLRPVSKELVLSNRPLLREAVEVAKPATDWLLSQGAAECLAQARSMAGLLNLCSIGPAKESGKMKLILCGHANCVEFGKKLLTEVHLKHQAELQQCEKKISKLAQKLDEAEFGEKGSRVEFGIEDSILGVVIGKQGSNVCRIQDQFDVTVTVLNRRPQGEPTRRLVRISGATAEAVEEAQRNLQYVQVDVPLKEHQVGWILGKGFQNIHEIAQKAELVYAKLNENKQALQLCGLRENVEHAKLLVKTHADYLPVYEDMGFEFQALNQQEKKMQKKRSTRSAKAQAFRRKEGIGEDREIRGGLIGDEMPDEFRAST